MKYMIEMSTKFKKDYKLAKKCGYDMSLLKEVIDLLADGKTLPEKYFRKNTVITLWAEITQGAVSVIFSPIGCLFTELKKSF